LDNQNTFKSDITILSISIETSCNFIAKINRHNIHTRKNNINDNNNSSKDITMINIQIDKTLSTYTEMIY